MSDPGARRLSLALAAAAVVLHAATSRGYGHFRDELYYVACARHLAFGYVDHPPLIAVVTAVTRALLGDSTPALRFPVALAAGGVVFLTGRMAAELGGGALAIVTASVAVMLAPVYVGLFGLLTMNAFEVLLWTLASLLLVRLLRTGDERLWVPFGAVVGLGLENKHSVLFFLVATVVGLAVTRARRHLATASFRRGMALAAVLFLPNVVWEIAHGVPTLEFLRNAQLYKNLARPPLAFLAEQVLVLSPLALPLWLAGLGFLLAARDGRPYRALGWSFLVLLGLVMAAHGKTYYVAPAYPVLFAAGGLVVERASRGRAVGWAVPVVVAATGLALAPLAKAVLPEETFIRYQHALGQDPGAGVDERQALGKLPQTFADQHGWPELAATIARVYEGLPADDRMHACIFVRNYGEAAALDFFGPAHGLPPVLSPHNSYWLWGPGRCDGRVLVVLGGTADGVRQYYEDVVQADVVTCEYCMPGESNLPVFVARRPRIDLRAAWRRLKVFI
ncbi:MAG TPA: glycosyltransferase family 39 protein [Candidatus Binatia bacterium]|nr:glycosyltransferase family 39 protein [Candidatus Binatia bacterium]